PDVPSLSGGSLGEAPRRCNGKRQTRAWPSVRSANPRYGAPMIGNRAPFGRRWGVRAGVLIVLVLLGATGAASAERSAMSNAGSGSDNAHRFEFTAIDGGKLPLSAWTGHPVLVVNTASFCGYTPQYR